METATINNYSLIFADYPDVVGVVQLCEMLGGICPKTAYKLLSSDQIQGFRIGNTYRIPKINVIRYILGEPDIVIDSVEHE